MSGEWIFLWRAFWIGLAIVCSLILAGYISQIISERRADKKREADLAALKARLKL